MTEYGGLIGTMYTDYSEEEIPENIRKYKERVDSLFLSKSYIELHQKIEKFSKKERDYLNCTSLDEIFMAYKEEFPLKFSIQKNMDGKIINLYCKLSTKDEIIEAYITAVECGNMYAIKKLVPNMPKSIINDTLCVGTPHTHVIKYLVEECGADPHYNKEYTFLKAISRNNMETVKYLVEVCGADISIRNNLSIEWASQDGHLEIIKYLLEKGMNYRYNNILIYAVENGHLHIVKFFLEEKKMFNNDSIQQALFSAATRGKLDIVKYLLDNYNFLSVNLGINPPQHHNLICGYLLECYYHDMFMRVCIEGHVHILKYLMTRGLYVETRKNYAVMIAAKFNQLRMVKYLVRELGAAPRAEGKYARKLALKLGYMNIAEFLTTA